MQNDYEKEGPEDGEYHFSDEGEGGYDANPEEENKAPIIAEEGLTTKFASYRRFIIMGGIFAVVLLVVYLVVAPPSTTPPITEISEAAPVPPVAAPVVTPAPAPVAVAVKEVVVPSPPPLPVAAPAPQVVNNTDMITRLTALEEQNTKLIAQLNSDYSNKINEFENQDKVMGEQVRAMNSRMAAMEAQMNQLVQALNKAQAPTPSSSPPPASASNSNENPSFTLPGSAVVPASQSSYTVQAIIPGRAWLRADNGETVTVAEGDMLRSVGRVTKIDPYDGTIQIDTGNKVVTLTYGNGDYA